MRSVPDQLRGAITDFVITLAEGLIEDDRWDWDLDRCDWERYRGGFGDPTILRTTLSVYLNTLQLNESDDVANHSEASFRAFQYFRAMVDESYPFKAIDPPFRPEELAERDWV